jgi:sugar/nucleoside kinase (ribokinase family)
MKRDGVVAFGDLNVDWVVRGPLGHSWADFVENGVTVLQDILEEPGGGAFTFARSARSLGIKTTIIGAIGQDVAGAWLSSCLKEIGATSVLATIEGRSTGRCFIARDARDVRFLVNSIENANHFLGSEQVKEHQETILSSQVVHIPGFCIRDRTKPRYAAVKEVFGWVENHNNPPVLVFDVLPHRVYETMAWEEFREFSRPVQVLISEVATMRRFLALGDRSEVITASLAEETLDQLRSLFRCIVLRFGASGCDCELCWDGRNGRQELLNDTGHAIASDKRGVGDRLTLDVLRNFFGFL